MDRDRRRAALTEADERAQERQREAAARLDKLRERQARTRQLIQLGSVCVARGFTDADELGAFFDAVGRPVRRRRRR